MIPAPAPNLQALAKPAHSRAVHESPHARSMCSVAAAARGGLANCCRFLELFCNDQILISKAICSKRRLFYALNKFMPEGIFHSVHTSPGTIPAKNDATCAARISRAAPG
ncbi:hypothetical protein [Variovorax ginsengisoli]|uniref:Uncharacterized protein n=1 Tax=Variovorax ginsengisoli TaxID=363844 RepID=A0ABT8S2D6_9BURK|nr:hypothetical protein [Variovorax ginsengisoli]MDN8613925.1 hypothetical protein [Variovorax ginsengisoli]MDO1533095.1 hypothetical protein [Variovorax ginsengisoli]